MHNELAEKYGFKNSKFKIDALRHKGSESNVSLLGRVCFKYSIPPCMFYNEYLNDGARVNHDFFNFDIASHFNSYTCKTNELNNKFHKLVSGKRDYFHSYSFLNSILDPQARGFISPRKRWCSSCYRVRQWMSKVAGENKIFDDLYWSVDSIQICMMHGEELTDKCPLCKSRQPYLSTSVELGYCHHCETFLGKNIARRVEHEELVSQQQQFHLFYVSTYDEFRPEMFRLTENLKALAGDSVTGFSQELGDLMGVSDDVVRKWVSGARKPKLETLFSLQEVLGLTGVHQLFLNEGSFIKRVALSRALSFNFNARSKLNDFQRDQDIKEYLDSIISGDTETLSRKKIAKKFRVSEGGLMSKFGPLMEEISMLHKNRLREEKEAKDQDVLILFDRALSQVISRRKKWTVSNVIKEIPNEKIELIQDMAHEDLTLLLMKAKSRRAKGEAFQVN